jgi:predicted patatin/cPLA2 family phospholipase
VNYNAALELIKQPPAGVRIQVFCPLRPLPVGPLTIEQKRIEAALALGHDEALAQAKLEKA